MKTLEETIKELVIEHGADVVAEAFTKAIKKPLDNPKPTCPPHYYWNGHACVPDIGE